MTELSNWKISDLIPEGYLARLLFWRDQTTRCAWEVGDMVNELCDMALANDVPNFERQRVISAVAQVLGKSARTVRMYADTAAHFKPSVRQEFDLLAFYHFAYAARWKGERDGKPGWWWVLHTAMEYAAEHSIPPSVERLESMWEYILGQPARERPAVLPSVPPSVETPSTETGLTPPLPPTADMDHAGLASWADDLGALVGQLRDNYHSLSDSITKVSPYLSYPGRADLVTLRSRLAELSILSRAIITDLACLLAREVGQGENNHEPEFGEDQGDQPGYTDIEPGGYPGGALPDARLFDRQLDYFAAGHQFPVAQARGGSK